MRHRAVPHESAAKPAGAAAAKDVPGWRPPGPWKCRRSCGGAAAAAQLRRRADMLGAGKRQRLRPLVGTWRGGHSSLILALARPCARQSGTESEGAGRVLKRQGRGGTAGPAWNGRAGVERQGRGGTASSNGRAEVGRHPQTAGTGRDDILKRRGRGVARRRGNVDSDKVGSAPAAGSSHRVEGKPPSQAGQADVGRTGRQPAVARSSGRVGPRGHHRGRPHSPL